MPARRRAERFDTLVEAARTAGAAPTGADPRYADLLDVVAALRAAPEVQPRPEFVADLRDRLMAAADSVFAQLETELTPPELRRGSRRHEKRLAVAAGALAMVGATTSMAVAAQSALPGDALYPIKRAIESAETELSLGEAKSTEMLGHARTRLAEVSSLVERDTTESRAAVAGAIAEFSQQAEEAADQALTEYAESGQQAPVIDLRDFTSTSMDTLASLDPVVPADARDDLAQAAQLLARIDGQALAACPACGVAALVDVPTAFLVSAQSDAAVPVIVTPGQVLKPAKGSAPPGPKQAQTSSTPTAPAVPPPVTGPTAPGGQLLPDDDGGSTNEPDLLGDLLDGSESTGDGSTGTTLDGVVDTVDKTVDGAVDNPVTGPVTDPLLGDDGLLK